jgi:sucrose-6-phosphate hydrolase SacC (GH32 family)
LTSAGLIKLNVIIDRSSVEAFFFDGLYSMTNLVFSPIEAKGISVWIDDPSLVSLDYFGIIALNRSAPFSD